MLAVTPLLGLSSTRRRRKLRNITGGNGAGRRNLDAMSGGDADGRDPANTTRSFPVT